MPARDEIVGRFLVRLAGRETIGLSAEEAASLLGTAEGQSASAYRIHRVDEHGRMELVGVPEAEFHRDDCLLFFRPTVAQARADFDAILELARLCPPPCRLRMELSRADVLQPAHVVALIFLEACSSAVGQWLARCDRQPGDLAQSGQAALAAYRDAAPRVVLRELLDIRTVTLPAPGDP